jgi:tight adherence protein B
MIQILLISISSGLLVYFLVHLNTPISEKEIVKERIKKYFRKSSIDDIEDQVIRERYEKAQKKKNMNKLVSKEFSDYVASSGVRLTANEFLYAWIGSVFIPMFLFSLVGLHIITVTAMGILGFVVPPLLLQRARRKRQELFSRQLGEALVIMGNAVKGGFSFRQAMESVASDMQTPIAAEFERAIREIHFGVPQEEALLHMTERMKNRDLDLLVSAVLTSAKVGGNLSDIMDVIANTIKDRIRIKQEVRVLTSSGRISALIIGLLPLILFIALMFINPEYVKYFINSFLGNIMLVVSVILELIGFLAIRKIADIQY